MNMIKQITVNGRNYSNVPFDEKQLKELGLTDAEITAEKTKLDLVLHAKKVGAKVGVVLSAKNKDLQTQSNIQAKFSMIDTKTASNRSAEDKAVHKAILALGVWVGDVMAFGKTLKQDVNADIEAAEWPELDAQSSVVIKALVAEL